MSVFAAVDIGANSVRLKIARVVRHRLRTVHEKRVVTRLGESVFREGTLSPESMDATVEVLRKFRRAVREFSADRVRVAATSALRDARNSLAFVAWARLATGWKVETVSGLEEGRLIHLGVVANTRIGKRNVLLVDLGGGSCEITASEKGHIREMVSLPLGAVRLTEEFLRHDPPTSVELHRLRVHIAGEVGRIAKRIGATRARTAIATPGTAAALAGAAREVEPRSRGLKGRPVSRAAALRLAELLFRLDVKGRMKLRGIGPHRNRRCRSMGLCRTDGALQSLELPLFAPRAAGRIAGPDAR